MATDKKFCFNFIYGFVNEIHMGFGMGQFEFLLFQDKYL